MYPLSKGVWHHENKGEEKKGRGKRKWGGVWGDKKSQEKKEIREGLEGCWVLFFFNSHPSFLRERSDARVKFQEQDLYFRESRKGRQCPT